MKQGARQVWLDIRWLENAFRFHSDMVLGISELLRKEGVEDTSRLSSRIGKDPDPCVPFWTCKKTIQEAKKVVELVRKNTHKTLDGVIDLLDQAQEEGITTIEFRPTQLPAYPEGSLGNPPKPKMARTPGKKRAGVTSRA